MEIKSMNNKKWTIEICSGVLSNVINETLEHVDTDNVFAVAKRLLDKHNDIDITTILITEDYDTLMPKRKEVFSK